MLKKYKILFILFFVSMVAVSCQKNYYSGKAKSSDCGCPAKKGMVGY
ncbi:MAG TPA: hypothetical protein VI548_14140 [Chitinophagaceae bacterium]|nr:hypothetical protein [Chitinophagaceae bacterium]